MNSHSDIRKRLSAYCGGDLNSHERAEIEAHLSSCPGCRANLAYMKITLQLIKSVPEVEAPVWMKSRIMAHLREEPVLKPSLLQRFWFPLRAGLPVRLLALLVVCVSGYYLSISVDSDLKLAQQQQLQDMPHQPAPANTPAPAFAPPGAPPLLKKLEQKDVSATPPTQPVVPRPEKLQLHAAPKSLEVPVPTPQASAPQVSALPAYAPPPVAKERFAGKSESVQAAPPPAPAAESANRAQDAVLEKKSKRSRRMELGSELSSSVMERTAGSPAGVALPKSIILLNMNDATHASTLLRDAITRFGGTLTEDQSAQHRFKFRIAAERQKELLDFLQQLGRITERPAPPAAGSVLVELTIQW